MNTVRKIKLTIVNENEEVRKQQYKFIRDSQYAQYLGLNRCMGYIMAGYYASGMDIKSDTFKEYQKNIKNTSEFFKDINFGKGIDSKSNITVKVKKDFSIALKNGLAKGERSSINYKRTFPLMTRGRCLNFKYAENDIDVLINWVNGIQFRCIIGEYKNSLELQHTLHKVITKEYLVCQSQLYFNNKNELILALTIDIPESQAKRDIVKDRVLGVDLGLAVPVYMSLNDIAYIKKSLGSYTEFAKQKAQFKSRRNRLHKQLEATSGGRGRKDKLKALDSFREKESNFAKTYNHFLSKKIIEFAFKNNCEYIHLEKITSKKLDSRVLGLWTYYDLQKKIEYKAEREGIKIRYVNPAYTSQRCSKCGSINEENRISQAKFKCIECTFESNADYNASRNIALSTEYIK